MDKTLDTLPLLFSCAPLCLLVACCRHCILYQLQRSLLATLNQTNLPPWIRCLATCPAKTGSETSFWNYTPLPHVHCGILPQCRSTCSAVSLPCSHRHSLLTPRTLTKARNYYRLILLVLAQKSTKLSAFFSLLYIRKLLKQGKYKNMPYPYTCGISYEYQ